MAVNDVYRLSVDYTLATQVTSPVSGKTAFVPMVQFYSGGTAFDVAITSPLGTKTIAQSVAVTPATSSVWAASQSGAWNITNISGTISLPTGAATETTLSAMSAKLPSAVGPQTDAASLSVVPSTSQNPIFDHTNGTKTSVTTSATVITPPTGCQFVRISSDVDIFVNTAGSAAVDNGTSIRVIANVPEVIPVTAATAVTALSSSGTATVRCTPFKVR